VLRKRALTHSVRKTGLHLLNRYDEGMRGRLTRLDMVVKTFKASVENACSRWKYMEEFNPPLYPYAHILRLLSQNASSPSNLQFSLGEILRISEHS
jgi:hypothetical protein